MRYIDADLLEPDTEWDDYKDGYMSYSELQIRCAKTADVRENIKGEWIDCGIHGDWAWEQDGHGNCWHIWKCSQCEYKTEHCSNFCPNCGADMRDKS